MELRYKCLIIDHDDTSVESTVSINYPAYLRIMNELRPDARILTPDEFFSYAAKGSFIDKYYKAELGFSDAEVTREIEIWQDYVKDKNPSFYDGFLDILRRYKAAGGRVVVASHSFDHMVNRHYVEFQKGIDVSDQVYPDMIFGWTDVADLRKPHPNVVYEAMSRLNSDVEKDGNKDGNNDGNNDCMKIGLSDILILDDLKPGYEMAVAAGVDFAWAGWGHNVPEIVDYMKRNVKYMFSNVKDFERFIFI